MPIAMCADAPRNSTAAAQTARGVSYSRAHVAHQNTSPSQLFSNSPLTALPRELQQHGMAPGVEKPDLVSWTMVTHKKNSASTSAKAGPGKSSKGFMGDNIASVSTAGEINPENSAVNDSTHASAGDVISKQTAPAKKNTKAAASKKAKGKASATSVTKDSIPSVLSATMKQQ
ncbi:hypothetical protein DXG01_003040 [Tephrocybe rancida]|nr:hypothetical protein DXG01_003040 [Tephrocybe rancida]